MHPDWLAPVAWTFLSLGFLSSAVVLWDIAAGGHHQQMAVMNAVYPISGLYWGPVALWFYFAYGRRMSKKALREQGHPAVQGGSGGEAPAWWQVAKGVAHCGGGCTLGDIAGAWLVATLGLALWDNKLYPELALDIGLAWILGIAFQYYAIAPMKNIRGVKGVWAAVKADTLSIAAFEIGLFGWMAISYFLLWEPPLEVPTAGHWWMMQVGMIIGFGTAWPVNDWLIRKGIKERM